MRRFRMRSLTLSRAKQSEFGKSVNYLLDTSIVLWSVVEEHKLNSRVRGLLSSAESVLYLSVASVWEVAIKYYLGGLPLHEEPEIFIPEVIQAMGMQSLDINYTHAIEAGRLPAHHRDPFDRMLVAQARTEGMILLTADRIFRKYDVEQVYCGR